MSEAQTTRDPVVAAALSALEVPEHAPGFDAVLRRRLEDHRGSMRRGRQVSLRLALVAAVLGVAALAVGIRVAGDSVETASAAEVQARVRAALGSVATMQGRLVSTAPDPLTEARTTRRWTFALTVSGDFRLDELGGPGRLAYDAERGVERQLNTSASMGVGLFGSERRGLAPGLPDPGPAQWLLQRDLGSVVRALLAARDPRVEQVREAGRETWRVEVDVRPNAIVADADHLSITVDQATGIPVRVVEMLHGEARRVLRVEGLRLDAPLPDDAFELPFPAGVDVFRTDAGFRRTSLPRVARAVGYAPLVPAWVPPGFVLAEVAVARQGQPTGSEAANPPSEDVVSLSFRRGFDQLVVTTRLARPAGADVTWSDPLATGQGFVDEPEPVTISAGALAGIRADLLIVPRATPHVWALTDRLVVTVSGDLDRSELLHVTDSLREQE
jgi:hypothetical protein